MVLSRIQRFREDQRILNQKSIIKECFYHRKDECNGSIKQTHSIQKNGRLSLIEGEVNGNRVIYTFTEYVPNEQTMFSDLTPIGKNEASTFFGFCDHHDTVLFSPIENVEFDGSLKHCFLHSYRAFAHSYHRAKEEIKLYTDVFPNYQFPSNKKILVANLSEKQNDFKMIEVKKKVIDEAIENSYFNALKYFVHEIQGLFPIACSSIINPPVSYKNVSLNEVNNRRVPLTDIILTVLPDFKKTIIIFAVFKEDRKANIFIRELKRVESLTIKKIVSSILISCAENTFFSPRMWEKLGEEGRKQLLLELGQNYPEPILEYKKRFFLSKINFFNDKFRD